MKRSESIASIAKAMSAAQAKIGAAKKDSQNPHFKSRYADLASVWDACREQLAANKIAVVQSPEVDEHGRVNVTTLLTHDSGEWMESTLSLRPMKDDPQAVGSAITYGRRYGLAAMVGVAPDDDDGEAAMARNGGHAERSNGHDDRRQRSEPIKNLAPKEQPKPASVPPASPAYQSFMRPLMRAIFDKYKDRWGAEQAMVDWSLKQSKTAHGVKTWGEIMQWDQVKLTALAEELNAETEARAEPAEGEIVEGELVQGAY